MNRAFIEFLERLEASPYKLDVKIINTIHDALYILVRNEATAVHWVNENLIECMEWQKDPRLHSDIKLGAELDIGYNWAYPITLSNSISLEDVQQALSKLSV